MQTLKHPLATAILAMAFLSTMDALVKYASASVSTWEIVFLRYAFGLAVVLPFAWRYVRAGISRDALGPNLGRGVLVIMTASAFFFALGRLPLVEAITLAFTSPIWMVVIARVLLGEPFTVRAAAAVGLGFAGVLIVYAFAEVDDTATRDTLGIAAALSAAFTLALSLVLVRQRAAYDAVPVMVLLQNVAALAIATPIGLMAWDGIPSDHWVIFLAVGTLGTFGHLLLSRSFARAKASDVAPAEYTALIWAVLFGVLFFDEWPGPQHFAAAGLIALGCAIAARAKPEDAARVRPVVET